MKTKITSIILILVICCLSSCSVPDKAGGSDFFFWMNGYVASPLNEEFTLSLTYYFKNIDYLEKNRIASFSFENCDAVIVDSFLQEDMNFGPNAIYRGHSFQLKIKYLKSGVFMVDKVKINLKDGNDMIYPIGNWCFDIGEPQSKNAAIDTWGGVTSTGNASEFAYSYTKRDSNCVVTQLKYGNGLSLDSKEGVSLQGKVKLEGEAPVKFIKTKLTVDDNGYTEIVYGHGCYCGSLGIDERDVQMALEHSQQYFKLS